MTELPISGQLDVTVNDSSLRSARDKIESEVGDLSVDVNASVSGGGSSGFSSDSVKLEKSQLEELEFVNEQLDELISVQGSGGAFGGGVLTELFGSASETAGDVAVETGNQVADTISNAISTAVGNTIANEISGTEVTVEDKTLDVEETEPIEVHNPDSIPVDSPRSIPVNDPSPLEVNDPSPLQVNDPSPLQVEQVEPLPVTDIEPLPVDREPLPVEDVEVTIESDTPATRAPREPSQTDKLKAIGGASAIGATAGTAVGGLAGGIIGSISPDPATTIGGAAVGAKAGSTIGGAIGTGAGIIGVQTGLIGGQTAGERRASAVSDPGSQQVSRQDVTVNVDQQIEVTADTGNLREDILSETEAMIDRVERRVDQLEREITS